MFLILLSLLSLSSALVIDEYSSAILKCEIESNFSTLQWEYQFPLKTLFIAYKNLTNITFYNNIEATYSDKISLLKILNVSLSDSGDYFCLTYNSSGYYTGTSWRIIVKPLKQNKPLVYIDTSEPHKEDTFAHTVNFIFSVSLAVFILLLLCLGFLNIYCKNDNKSYSILV